MSPEDLVSMFTDKVSPTIFTTFPVGLRLRSRSENTYNRKRIHISPNHNNSCLKLSFKLICKHVKFFFNLFKFSGTNVLKIRTTQGTEIFFKSCPQIFLFFSPNDHHCITDTVLYYSINASLFFVT